MLCTDKTYPARFYHIMSRNLVFLNAYHQCLAGVCSYLGASQSCAEGHPHLCGLLSYPDACLCPSTATGEAVCQLPYPTPPVCNQLLFEQDNTSKCIGDPFELY